MPTQGLGPATPKSTSPAIPSDPATQQGVNKKGKPIATAREKEATTSTPRITRTRSQTSRVVPPIPDNAQVLHRPAAQTTSTLLATSSPHRPAPQLTVRDLSADLCASSLFSEAPSTSNGKSKKATPRDTAKKDEFERLRGKILDEGEVNSLDTLAKAYTEVIA
ncbi:hypothetical protein B0H13DRAFT_2136624, partial [Mycena leptocephala]